MRTFLIQRADGSYLGRGQELLWTPLADFARAMSIDDAVKIQLRMPDSRVIEKFFAGSFSAEELRDADDFVANTSPDFVTCIRGGA